MLRIAYPLHLGEDAEGAIVIEVEAPLRRQARIIQLLRWGEAWMNLALKQAGGSSERTGLGGVIMAGLAQGDLEAARTAVLALLPGNLGCTRVGLGRGEDDRVHLLAVSDVPELDRRSLRAKAVERAMQEALTAARSSCWPQATASDAPDQAQRDLVETAALTAVCSVPVNEGLRQPLVFLFEFAEGTRWGAAARGRCEEAAAVVAPLLELGQIRDASWMRRFGRLLSEGLQQVTGRSGRLRRVLSAIVVLALVVLGLGDGEYRVSAPAAVEGAVQRAVVAPFEGYIDSAGVRAGQQVAKGDLLARLDDRDLQSEHRSLAAEAGELAKQHRQAVAQLDHGKAKVIEAQLAQTRAGLALVADKLARTELRAPLDGLVISGDWSRSLGVPVSRGELLFEISPLDAYRVAIRVSDREIANLAPGQPGELILSALPRQPVQLSVTDIATLADEAPGEPAFRVEAEVADGAPALRPGMEGVAKITVGARQRWWIWTHALTDWLRLQLWRWLP
jgi:RND family efflux transporter MFP subunit